MNEREQLIADRDEGKILILSGTLPGSAGVGNLLIGDCCAVIPKERRVFYGIVKSHEVEQCITNGLANKVFVRKYESAFRPFSGLIGVAISVLAFQFVTRPWMWRVARSIVRAAKRENDIVSLWVILDTPTTICIARRVANALKLPLTTFVMDACEHASTQLYHDRLTRNRIRKEFDAVMNTAVASGVAGESMKEKYEKSYGLPCQILRQGATIESGSGRVWSPHSPYFRIGFAGTITATDAFQSMIAALDSVQWRIDERPVILRIIGAFYHIKTMSPQHIEHMGWRTREETRQLLSECDVLYLPQPFNETQRLFAELSFPNKLISYLGAQRPVILHAPHYASLTSFYKSFKVGRICSSLSPPDLVDAVTHYAQAPVDAVSLEIAETRRAVEEELNIATLQANCRNLLGDFIAPRHDPQNNGPRDNMKSVANSTHRLLIVAPSAYTLGGLAVWLDYLIPGLSQLGWDVTLGLVSGPRHHNVKAYLDRYTVPRAIAIHCHCSTDAGRVHAVRTAIQKVDPDIVLTVNIPHAIRATALERNSGRDVRAVMSCHGIQEDLFEDMKILQEDLDAVVCTNRLASRLSQTLGGIDSERVFHCACGAVVPKHLPDLPDNTSFTIGYSGRLEQSQKRVHDLVPVAAELKSKGLNFKVLVAGSGPEEQQLNDAINQHGLTEHFGLLGFVPAEEMQDCFYTKLDALLVTSSWETGPIVIWEAMAAGTPVVTSRYIGSGAEGLLCHVRNCLMFDVGDCDSAAAQLMSLRDDPTMNQQIRQQAFDTVNTHLSCDVSVHKWNKVLEKLLQAVPRKNRVNSVIETLPSGRLDRLIGRRAAAVLRRLLKRMPPDSGPGGEWPHTIAGSTMNENEFFELAARLDRCEIDASVIQ